MLNANKILGLATQGNLHEIIELCKQTIIEDAAKEKGGNSLVKRTKAAQKVLSELQEYQLKKCGAQIKEHYNGEKYQCFTNGIYGFILKDELQGLPQATDEFDLYKLVSDAESKMIEKEEINIDLGAVKVQIAEYKAANKGKKRIEPAYYDIENHRYNAQFILDCFAILGGNVKFYQDNNNELSAAILESENGKAILLPMRKKKGECN